MQNKNGKIVSYAFIGLLLLVVVHPIVPETMPGRMVLDVVRIPIMVATIVLGVVTFYLNRDVLSDIEEESQQEEIAERKREAEFRQRYPKVNRVWGVRWVARLMYKEGWWYSGGMISIILFGLFLRLFYLDYLDGSDNYTIIAVKNLYENGVTYYKPDGYITPNLMLFFSKIFGYNSFALRLPSILYSFITMVCIYFISKNFNKKIAIISLILFSISPWSIVVSRLTRDYAFDCMIGCIILIISIKLYQKIIEKDSKKEIIYLLFLPVLIRFISEFNHRSQTQLVIIIPFITLLCVVWFYLLSYKSTQQSNSILSYISNYKMYKRWGIFFLFSSIIIIAMYFVDHKYFNFGFHYDLFYLDVFFNPLTESPWQWFHNNHLNIYFIIALFFFPLLTSLFLKNKKLKLLLLLYSIFFFGLGLFMFKFVSHIHYSPTRYIYFLFPVYTIIFSINFYYFINLVKNSKIVIPIFILFIFLFFNFNSIYYAIYPIAAYNNENIYNLKIDNIGLGRFNMYPVVDFIKNDLNSSENETFVFGGRYGEFILLLNYSMDPERYLLRTKHHHYDVGKNMFVESSYFNYHELKDATLSSKNGYFITCDSNITDYEKNPIQELNNQSFVLYETDFHFINEINIFKIYYWNQSHSQ
jgi:hypothetical protein